MLGKRRESLTAQLVREITDRIDTGAYAPGAKLPTEQELINEFGVSRTVVREAISNLKASALVSTHQGIGAFVLLNPPPPAFRIETDNMQLIEEVVRGLELRIGIELEAAALSAQRRTAADLEAMEAACVAMDKAIETGEGNIEADLEFHRAIAQSTQNSNFVNIFNYLGKVLIPRTLIPTHRLGSVTLADYLRRINAEHHQIMSAIRAKDPDGARAAMRMHLSGSRDRLLQSAQIRA
jgi:GntR family transcriptional regulator, transcriptional repressor for pyruvate dehydrogenase complex